ncbi:hypothetical protein P7C73_g3627, partial [Tremellales sp. Uapishka_1]
MSTSDGGTVRVSQRQPQRRKTRCDKELPCGNCRKRGVSNKCEIEPTIKPQVLSSQSRLKLVRDECHAMNDRVMARLEALERLVHDKLGVERHGFEPTEVAEYSEGEDDEANAAATLELAKSPGGVEDHWDDFDSPPSPRVGDTPGHPYVASQVLASTNTSIQSGQPSPERYSRSTVSLPPIIPPQPILRRRISYSSREEIISRLPSAEVARELVKFDIENVAWMHKIAQALNLHRIGSDTIKGRARRGGPELVAREVKKRIWWQLIIQVARLIHTVYDRATPVAGMPYSELLRLDAEMNGLLEEAPSWMQSETDAIPPGSPSWVEWQRLAYMVSASHKTCLKTAYRMLHLILNCSLEPFHKTCACLILLLEAAHRQTDRDEDRISLLQPVHSAVAFLREMSPCSSIAKKGVVVISSLLDKHVSTSAQITSQKRKEFSGKAVLELDLAAKVFRRRLSGTNGTYVSESAQRDTLAEEPFSSPVDAILNDFMLDSNGGKRDSGGAPQDYWEYSELMSLIESPFV